MNEDRDWPSKKGRKKTQWLLLSNKRCCFSLENVIEVCHLHVFIESNLAFKTDAGL